MLWIRTDAFEQNTFFSGGNSCVPSVASDHRSSGKFPFSQKAELQIRLDHRVSVACEQSSSSKFSLTWNSKVNRVRGTQEFGCFVPLVLPNFRIRQHWRKGVCNSHCRIATKSYGVRMTLSSKIQDFFQRWELQIPIYFTAELQIRQNTRGFR